MDPNQIVPIAASVVAALAPYLAKGAEEFAKKAGSAAWERASALHSKVAERLRSQPQEAASLVDFQAAPGDPTAQIALQRDLVPHLAGDPDFTAELVRLLAELKSVQTGPSASFHTQVSGGSIGQVLNIAQAGSLTIDNTQGRQIQNSSPPNVTARPGSEDLSTEQPSDVQDK